MSARIHVVMSGPIFDRGTTSRATDSFLDEVRSDVAHETVNQIQRELSHVLKHPTGFYKSHIHTSNLQDVSLVNDGGIVYGPWLEGVGSRNKTTRFKGYHTFRRVFQRINGKVEEIAEKRISDLLRKLS